MCDHCHFIITHSQYLPALPSYPYPYTLITCLPSLPIYTPYTLITIHIRTVDHTGYETYTIFIRDLKTGELLKDEIEGTDGR